MSAGRERGKIGRALWASRTWAFSLYEVGTPEGFELEKGFLTLIVAHQTGALLAPPP